MNLVKAQELLKGMPIQELQKYANGFSPEMIPPWLAMGEMNAKMEQQKKMAAMQGAAGGPQASVKEQIEQKAGLMALQAQQQAQAQQAQAQQAQNVPMPAPEGVPQPQEQPQPQQPAMMASGGLAGAPVHFNFDGGGIVAFAEGDKVEGNDDDLPDWAVGMRAKRKKERAALEAERARNMAQVNAMGTSEGRSGAVPRLGLMAAPPAESVGTLAPPPPAMVPGAAPPPGAPQPRPPGLPGAMAPRPPAAPAAPPGPAQGSAEQMALQAVKDQRTAMTPEAAMGQEQKFAANYGLDKPQDTEQRGLLAAMKQRNEQYMAGRPSAELGATLRGFSQGYGGASAAGDRASQETYNTDIANQRQNLNAIDELVKRGQEVNKNRYTSAGSLFGEDKKATDAFNKERMQTLGTMSGAEKQERASKYSADTHYKAALAQISAAAARNNMDLTQNQKAQLADKAMDNVNAQIKANMKLQMDVAKDPAILQEMVRKETDRLMSAAGGTTMAPAPGAPRPGGTPADVTALLQKYGGK